MPTVLSASFLLSRVTCSTAPVSYYSLETSYCLLSFKDLAPLVYIKVLPQQLECCSSALTHSVQSEPPLSVSVVIVSSVTTTSPLLSTMTSFSTMVTTSAGMGSVMTVSVMTVSVMTLGSRILTPACSVAECPSVILRFLWYAIESNSCILTISLPCFW